MSDGTGGGLSGLDWVVILASTVALIVLVLWLVQGQPVPARRQDQGEG